MTDDLPNLAKHVKARRDQRDWTQLDVHERGGPSNSTLTQIEAARPPAPSRATMRKLDIGLDWVSGSAKRCLAGGEPTTLEQETVGTVAHTGDFVKAPGETVTEGVKGDDLVHRIVIAMRAEFDQDRARQRDELGDLSREVRELSERVERLERDA